MKQKEEISDVTEYQNYSNPNIFVTLVLKI
jgi:hypothetical protein